MNGTKKIFNEVNNCVDESLKGFTLLNPGLKLHADYRFISKSQETITSKVAILSGGGSGHEPFCTGYVGNGMLSGAVAGNIFASPPKAHIIYGIRYLSQYYKGGILVIIPNYTGDCLNFGMAVEQAKSEGIKVESFTFGDDSASGQHSIAGKRGMCGLVIAYKIAGGLSSDGRSLDDILKTLNDIQSNISTIGISLQPCSLPGQLPLFTIEDDEMELGTGVHGEAGIKRLKLTTAKEAMQIILEHLDVSLQLTPGTHVVILINNLGSTSQLEQNIICNEVYTQIERRNIMVERMYAGMLMTSLNMSGFQIAILKLPKISKNDWLNIFDLRSDSPCWVGSQCSIPSIDDIICTNLFDLNQPVHKAKQIETNSYRTLSSQHQKLFKECLMEASKKLKEKESKLNELDGGCGDGDCGTTLKNLAEGISQTLSSMNTECPGLIFQELSNIAESKMGGTSGAIYSLGFTSMAKRFMEDNTKELPIVWANAIKAGTETIMKYGRAKPGDRTIIDTMLPAVETYNNMIVIDKCDIRKALEETLNAANEGCKATKDMKARAGRASYVNVDHLTDVDAGAYGFIVWLEAIIKTILTSNIS